ncbi:hypothetical protein ABW20_dc0108715 [Dactylellina cionopaga]|nr:hypothetical protein ABW20_dc0108715 [Dactylellina cionopaga]
MDGLSAAASVIAVIQLATSVAKVCGQYLMEVKNAKKEIEYLRTQSETILQLLDHTQRLLEGPYKAKLSASRELGSGLKDCKAELEGILVKLEQNFTKQLAENSKRRNQVLNRFGVRDFKWPFTKKEVYEIIRRLEKIQQSIDRALQLDQIHVVLSVEQEAHLAKLLVADGATFGSFEDEHEPECLPDTRTELLKDIKTWISEPMEKHMFWLCGMAGTGKSTISRTVARTLHDNHQLAASFFFKRGKGNRGDASRFFGTLANSLRLSIPELGPEISKAVENDPDICRKALREQFKNLIIDPLERVELLSTPKAAMVIIIDALDECDGEDSVKLLLRLLSQCQKSDLDLRIFITSRPETPINLGFEMLSGEHKDLVLHDIEESTIKHDISVFLKHEFASIRKERKREVGMDWPGEQTIEILTGMAIPLFISAATICRFVGDKKFPAQDRLDAVLKLRNASFASKLDKTYLPVFEQMTTGADPREVKVIGNEFQDIVGTIILLESPLSLLSLSQIMGKSEAQLLCVLDPLRSVLVIPDDTGDDSPIQMFHLSFREFLLDDANSSSWFWIDAKEAHRKTAMRCIALLAKSLGEDICDLKSPGIPISDISVELVDQKISSAIQYGCQYWVHHLAEGHIHKEDKDARK